VSVALLFHGNVKHVLTGLIELPRVKIKFPANSLQYLDTSSFPTTVNYYQKKGEFTALMYRIAKAQFSLHNTHYDSPARVPWKTEKAHTPFFITI